MRQVGEVVSHFKRFIICRSGKGARALMGKTVYSEKKVAVGIVVDVFGPVERPYLKILRKDGEDCKTLYSE